jgi:uncharacterized protein with HEPN domain
MPRERPGDAALMFDMIRYGRKAVEIVGSRTLAEFEADEVLRLAIERLIEIVGEAARDVSDATKAATPHIPWKLIVIQRNILAHDYGEIIPEKIWRVATQHIPELISQLEPLLPPAPADPEPPTAAE